MSFQRLTCALFFMLSLVASAGLLHGMLGNTENLPVAWRSEKLALADKWNVQVNTLAFGTSRMHQSFSPQLFDQFFAKTPYTPHSLNLALFGSSQVEQRFIAKQVLGTMRNPPGNVCLAFLEMNAGLNFPPDNMFHPRSVNLYTLDAVHFVAGFSGHSMGLFKQLGRTGVAVLVGSAHALNLGMLAEKIRGQLPPLREILPGSEDEHGYYTMETTLQEAQNVAEIFKTLPHDIHPNAKDILPGNYQLVADLAAVNPNVQFIYVVMPSTENWADTPEYPAEMTTADGIVPILNFARPDRYPELYKIENWRDFGHLTTKGDVLLTQLIAQETLVWLKAHPGAGKCGG